MRSLLTLIAVVLIGLIAAPVQAQDFRLPPPPEDHPPLLVGEFTLPIAFPISRSILCPGDGSCPFGGGGGVGASLSWRYPTGFAAGFGYDVWLLDGNSVYAITTLQWLGGFVRYYLLRQSRIHPFVSGGLGFILFGDTFQDNAPGAGLDAAVGAEIEISSTLAFTSSLGLRLFAIGPFRSGSDGVARAQGFGVSTAIALTFGLVLLQSPMSELR